MPENGAHFSGEGHLIEGQIEDDVNKTIRPIVCDEDGHLIIDLDASTITIGTVDQGTSGTDPWSIKIDQTGTNNDVDATVTNFPANQNVTVTNTPLSVTGTVVIDPASTAIVTSVTVTTSPTVLLATNALRKGLAVQNQDQVTFVKFDSTASTSLYSYELPRKGILEKDNYTGPVTAVTSIGSTTVMVTELV